MYERALQAGAPRAPRFPFIPCFASSYSSHVPSSEPSVQRDAAAVELLRAAGATLPEGRPTRSFEIFVLEDPPAGE